MKAFILVALAAGTLWLAGCETAVVSGHPVHRRYISYNDTDAYYRVHYREPAGRVDHRQHYYDDDAPRYRVDRRRYYYNRPHSRASVSFGF